MQILQIVFGLFLILVSFLDFFHTTLSGNGFGWISKSVNFLLNRVILLNQERTIFNYSGLLHLLVTTFVWLLLLFLGAFLVFTSGDEMVISASTYLPADYTERFYYTSYVLSTLGVGDFVPGNETSQVLTGILSFTGFILITTGMTYLLGVVNSVLSKKELAFYISSLGKDVEELYNFFKADEELSPLVNQSSDIRNQILKNASSYLAFPIVNYFLTKNRNYSAVVQIATLYEVLIVLRKDWKVGSIQHSKICGILNAIEYYLHLGVEDSDKHGYNEDKLNTLRSTWKKYGHEYHEKSPLDAAFETSLKSAGWDWDDVYELQAEDPKNLMHKKG